MYHGELYPNIVFRVLEAKKCILADSVLKDWKPSVDTSAGEVKNSNSKCLIYYCSVTFEEARSKKLLDEREEVASFAEQYNLGKPRILLLKEMGDNDTLLQKWDLPATPGGSPF